MKIELNLDKRDFSGNPVDELAKLYLEMQAEDAFITKMSEDISDKALRKNKPKLLKSLEKVKALEMKSAVTAAYLPKIWDDKDFCLLHGCCADITEFGLKYEIVPVIYHNLGNGNVSRAIDLFMPGAGLSYDEKMSWKENVEQAMQRHIENEMIVKRFYPSQPEFAEAERFLVAACSKVMKIEPAILNERLVKTDEVLKAAEQIKIDKIKKNSYTLEKGGVREQILKGKEKRTVREINSERER